MFRGGYRSKYFDTVLISIPWFRYRFDTILFSIPDVLKINFHNKNKLGIIEFIFQNRESERARGRERERESTCINTHIHKYTEI